jgi:hypothetical protein
LVAGVHLGAVGAEINVSVTVTDTALVAPCLFEPLRRGNRFAATLDSLLAARQIDNVVVRDVLQSWRRRSGEEQRFLLLISRIVSLPGGCLRVNAQHCNTPKSHSPSLALSFLFRGGSRSSSTSISDCLLRALSWAWSAGMTPLRAITLAKQQACPHRSRFLQVCVH